MNICIIEDNVTELKCVRKMSFDICNELKLPEPSVFCFSTSKEFTEWIYNDVTIDVCFLDIDLKSEYNGIKIAKIIKEKNYNTLIVFMTSYDYYLREVVQVEPFRFLSKPFNFDNFRSVFVDIYKRIILKNNEQNCMYKFKINGIIFSIDLKGIAYISSYKRKIYLYDIKQGEIGFYGRLDDVESEIKLLSDKFIRINKSYLINSDYIENIGKNSVTIQGAIYSISPKYKQNLKIIT